MISGIIHVLKPGGRWSDAPAACGPRKTLYNRFVRWAAKGVWTDIFYALAATGGPPAHVLLDSSAVKAHRCAAGAKGGSMPRRSAAPAADGSTKIHALSDGEGRPFAFLLTGGQRADCRAAEALLNLIPPNVIVHADRGYDSNAIRRRIEATGGMPNIPPKANRLWKNCFSRSSTAAATPSSARSAASRTSGASPPARTA